MSTSTPRRIYIDRDAAREEAIIRRVLVSQSHADSGSPEAVQTRKNAAMLFGLGRLVRGQLLRRAR